MRILPFSETRFFETGFAFESLYRSAQYGDASNRVDFGFTYYTRAFVLLVGACIN
jgi:hypothetical protein